jgi:anti-sigma B factor antagonist
VQVVAVSGEADAAMAPDLKTRIFGGFDAGRCHLIVDLTQVVFLDSSILAVFVGAHKRVRAGNGSIQLAGPPRKVRDVLEVTGLDEILPVVDTVDAALATLSADGDASKS